MEKLKNGKMLCRIKNVQPVHRIPGEELDSVMLCAECSEGFSDHSLLAYIKAFL